jgi:predicted acetyltransferase
MDVEIRTVSADELPEVVRAVDASWGHHADDDDIEDARDLAELDRTFAAFDRGRPVAVAAAVSFELTVPGGVIVPSSGLTDVGVLPTHRRRGLLSALMARHLDDARARGEAVAALVASEATIYRRFGFGPAVVSAAVEIDRARAAFAAPTDDVPGDLRLVGPEEAALLLPEAYDRYRRAQPGEVSRSDAYWDVILRDRERWREGASARFVVVHDAPDGIGDGIGDGIVDGYATYRMRAGWPQGVPDFALEVEEVVATSAPAGAALWRYLLDVDLVGTVSAWNVPVDDPLRWRLADLRALRVTAVRDLLWLNLVDVAAALSARRYAAPGRLVVEVRDAGRYLLDAAPDGATCRPAPVRSPDLTLRIEDLASTCLGGVPWATLARAGRVVEHTSGAARRADTLFASDPPPHSVTDF